jgi:hypothetical protein
LSCTSNTACLSCRKDFYLSGSVCLPCKNVLNNCDSCLNASTCLDCFTGYYLESNGSCVACSSPCVSCSSAGGCLSCIIGYYYAANSCSMCPTECLTCSSGTQCYSCIAGYYLDTNYKCIICSAHFPNCQYCNTTKCTQCNLYFKLNPLSSLCEDCSLTIDNCVECDNNGNCLLCNVGYFPNQQQCVGCSNYLSMC